MEGIPRDEEVSLLQIIEHLTHCVFVRRFYLHGVLTIIQRPYISLKEAFREKMANFFK